MRSTPNRRPGRETSAGTGDTTAPGLHYTRDEKQKLLSAAVTACRDRFARRGHHKDAANLLWEIDSHTENDGRCHLPQGALQDLLGWTDRKLREVRHVVEDLGWLQVIRGCTQCGNQKHAATRVNWPTIALCANRADINLQMQTSICKCRHQSANADSNLHDRLNKERVRAFEFLELEKNLITIKHSSTQQAPLEEIEACATGDFSLSRELAERTQTADAARRALRDVRWVQEAWLRACELLPDLAERDLRGFAIAAAWAARNDAKIEKPGALFVRLVQRRAWRLPARIRGKRVQGHIPNKAEILARPLLVALGLEHPRRTAESVDRDAVAAAAREAQLQEARKLIERSAAAMSLEGGRQGAPARSGS
jgi:hypothetical protein